MDSSQILLLIGAALAVLSSIVLEGEDDILTLIVAIIFWPLVLFLILGRAVRRKLKHGHWMMEDANDL